MRERGLEHRVELDRLGHREVVQLMRKNDRPRLHTIHDQHLS